MRIIAFDPGGTTGVATYDDHDSFENVETSFWKRESLGPGDHHLDLWGTLINFDGDAIVYETFTYQRRPLDKGVSLELVSKEYIGVIKLAHQRHAIWGSDWKLEPQSPSQRMFWTDEKLRKLSLWVSSPHERDATRHLLYYVTQTLKDDRFLQGLK